MATASVQQNPGLIPGIKPLPGLRKLQDIFINLNQMRDTITMLEHQYRTYGTISSRFFDVPDGEPGYILFLGADYNRMVLTNTQKFQRFDVNTLDDPNMAKIAHNLLFQNGEIHLAHRRLMMPAFHKRTIEGYRNTMLSVIEDYMADWQPDEVRDMKYEMHNLTLQIATQTLFGMNLKGRSASVGELVAKSLDLGVNPLVYMIPVNRPGFPRYRFLAMVKDIVAYIQALIDEKRQQSDIGDDTLSMLIHARDEDGGKLSDEELIGQTYTLFVAGHETTANGLTYILLLLSQHPQVMGNLLEELISVTGGNPPTLGQLSQMPLLDAVIKEGLRLFPPAALVNRVAKEAFEVDGFHFPKNTLLTISQYITHRLPELYEQPRRFLPERWETIQPSPYEYFPFGAGSRLCIGMAFSIMEMKLLLSTLLQRYRLALQPNSTIQRKLNLTLGVKGALPMMLHPQDKQFERSRVKFGGNVRGMVDWV